MKDTLSRRVFRGVVATGIVFGLVVSGPNVICSSCAVQASSEEMLPSITLLRDGNRIQLPVEPYQTRNGVFMLPFDALQEALNVKFEYNVKTKTGVISNDAYEVKFTIGNRIMVVNSSAMVLEYEPELKNGSVMLPLSLLVNVFHIEVKTEGNRRIVLFEPLPERKVEKLSTAPLNLPIKAEWKTFKTEYLQVYYYSHEDRVIATSYEYDRIYKYLYDKIGRSIKAVPGQADPSRTPVIMLEPDDFQTVLGGDANRFAAFWNSKKGFFGIKLVKDNSTASRDNIYRTLRHELVHAMTLSAPDSREGERFPYWMKEGVATYYEDVTDPLGVGRAYFMHSEVRDEELYKWSEIGKVQPDKTEKHWTSIRYGQSQSIWRYLAETFGEQAVLSLFYSKDKFPDSLEKLAGKPISQIEKDWLEYYKKTINEHNWLSHIKNSNDKIVYQGFFKNDLFEGYGRLTTDEGLYRGDFVKGKQHGYGKLLEKGTLKVKYEGSFKDGLYEGNGVQYLSDGYYEGPFVKGKKEGTGKWFDLNGNLQFTGDYHEDQLISQNPAEEEPSKSIAPVVEEGSKIADLNNTTSD